MNTHEMSTATGSSSIADVLERVLDKGVVVAGDIRVKLLDIELLTIQLRLVICSIDKAKEIGIDWWNFGIDQSSSRNLSAGADPQAIASRLAAVEDRLSRVQRAT